MNKKILGIFVCTLVVLSVLSTAAISNTLDTLEVDAGGPYEGLVGEEIQFDGSASVGTSPYKWSWDFGDDNFSNEEDPVHAYSTADVYTVILMIVDIAGETARNITTATITESEPLIADANGPYEGLVGEEIQFNSSATGGTPPYTYHWDFGDGNTSDEEDPVYTYDEADNYTVTLTVTDVMQNTDDDATLATITEESEPIFEIEIVGGIGVNVFINNVGDVDATEVDWNIVIDGGLIILTPEASDTISTIPAGESEEISIFALGFGLGILTPIPTITVSAECAEGSSAEENETAIIIGPYIIIQ